MLGRISAYEGAARGWMAEVIEADVGGRAVAAFEAGKAVGSRTAFAALGPVLAEVLGRRGDADVARSIEATGIPDQTVSLGEVACWVMQAQLRALPAEGRWEVVVERARRLNNLGIRQSELGQREAALDSAEEATAIYRKLAEASPDAFLPYLAGSLNTLAAMQSELGQREAALNSTEEALDILWPFFLATPLPFIRNTAIVLENTLKRLEGLGREPSAALLERIVIFDAIRGG